MPLFERAIPRLIKPQTGACFRCRFLNSRSFYASSSVSARATPKLRPKKEPEERKQIATVRSSKAYGLEDCIPPATLLEAAHKSGALVIEPEEALEFLKRYLTAVQYKIEGWEQRLSKEQHVTPSTIGVLAGILQRCKTRPQQMLGNMLMISASELGDKPATYHIISSALRRGTMDKYQPTLRQLGLIAKNDGDPKAMFLLAKAIYASRGEKQALEWLRKATRPPTGNLDFDGAGEALILEGLILARGGLDPEGAKAAWEKAAKDLDDPTAYFYLSQLEGEAGNLDTQKEYLLKASSAGMSEAWHNLGVLELEKIQKSGTMPKEIEEYGMAKEWFHVAAMNGFGLSILNMAQMYRSIGEIEEGLKWLEKAEDVEDEDVVKQAQELKEQWISQIGADMGAGEGRIKIRV